MFDCPFDATLRKVIIADRQIYVEITFEIEFVSRHYEEINAVSNTLLRLASISATNHKMESDDEPIGPIGRTYSIDEAAKALGISRKKLTELTVEFPYFTPNGNRKVFNDDDIRMLWLVKRINVTLPHPLDTHVKGASGRQYAIVRNPRGPWGDHLDAFDRRKFETMVENERKGVTLTDGAKRWMTAYRKKHRL